MRVAFVLQKVAGLRGGAERVVIELGRALIAAGHEVTLVTYEPGTGPPGYDTGEIRHVDLLPTVLRSSSGGETADRADRGERIVSARGNGPVLRVAKWHATHGLFARRLAGWLRKHPQDAVVGFLPPAISAVAFAKQRLGSQAPRTIASVHNVPAEDFGDSPRWDQNPLARSRNLCALEMVDAVTVLQPEFIDELPPGARHHAVVMPNAVAAPDAAPRTRSRIVVGVGRLTDVKRYDLLIRAFAQVGEAAEAWQLDLYGEGPERERLTRLAGSLGLADRVTLAGTTADISGVYNRARIFVHPARFEGFGLSVAEAVLHGVPVIAWSECSGVNRLVETEVTGLLLPEAADPVETLAASIRRLMTDPLDEETRAEGAVRLADRLAPTTVYAEWEQLLRS